jgi:hypothetical protein
VEAALIADGRLVPVSAADDVVLRKKDPRLAVVQPRDPSVFVDRLLELARRSTRRARLGHLVADISETEPPPFV